MALFIKLYKVILTFEFVDENLQRDHSNESNGGLTVEYVDEISRCNSSN